MLRSRYIRLAGAPLLLLLAGTVGYLAPGSRRAPRTREITVRARKYSFTPAVIRVSKGDRLVLTLVSEDVTHGFFVEGYDIEAKIPPEDTVLLRHPSQGGGYEPVEKVVFTAHRTGKFRYRCSHTCGYLHPFMLGELIVGPNRTYSASLGLLLGLLPAAALVLSARRQPRGNAD